MQAYSSSFLDHFVRYAPLMKELVSRDLKVKYRRSILGYLWSLLNPLLMMLVMTLVFSNVFRVEVENFPMYLICGQTLFNFFSESTTMSMRAILDNGALLRKVYIPKFIFPLARILSSFTTLLFSLTAILLVMVITGTPFSWTALLFPVPMLTLLIFCCGVGLVLAALSVYFRDITHLYSVLTLAWMYATPIFYPLDGISPVIQHVIKLNPLYHYINLLRNLVIYGNIPGPNTWFVCFASSMIMLLIGGAIFHKLQGKFILYI